jgi:AAA15 family ATPase/GTPase
VRITTLSLQSFRSFKEGTDFTNLKEVNVLIGPNQAGKSNVIEALRLLRSLANRDGETVRPFTNYVFDQSIKNKIVVDIALRLSQEEKNKICKWLLQHNTIFSE